MGRFVPEYVIVRWRRRKLLRAILARDCAGALKTIEAGVDPNFAVEGLTPLNAAFVNNLPDVFDRLIQCGASISPRLHGFTIYKEIIDAADGAWRRRIWAAIKRYGGECDWLITVANLALQRRRYALGTSLVHRVLRASPDARYLLATKLQPVRLAFDTRRHQRIVREFARHDLLQVLSTTSDEGSLHVALRAHCDDIVRELIVRGIDVHDFPSWGKPPLLVAAEENRVHLFPLLCSDGSSKSAGATKCEPVVVSSARECLEFLRHGGNPDSLVDNEPLIQFAMRRGQESATAVLLSFGASLATWRPFSEGPIAEAARSGSVGLLRLLLWKVGDPNEGVDAACFSFTCRPMIAAVVSGNTAVVRELVEAGGDVNSRNRAEETPLTVAAYMGDVKMTRLLLEYGADINLVSSSGMNALHWCVRSLSGDAVTIAQLLLDSGIDVSKRDCYGLTPLAVAMERSKFDIGGLIRGRGATDEYSVPREWSAEIVCGKYDYFMSYRHRLFASEASVLARALIGRGCSVYIDTSSLEVPAIGRLGREALLKAVYVAVRSSKCTLFFDTELEMALIPANEGGGSRRAFSWQLFERIHSTRVFFVGRGVTAERVQSLADGELS